MRKNSIAAALVLLVSPVALAETVEPRFIAGHWTSDGSTVTGTTVEFASLFGDAGSATSTADRLGVSPLRYNATNLRLMANSANCGDYLAGEGVNVTLRLNGANVLWATCMSGSPAFQSTVDNRVVEVLPGDRLVYAVSNINVALGLKSPKISVSVEGYTNTTVVDMTNEILEATNLTLPLILLLAVAVWFRLSRDPLLGILSVIAGAIATMLIWSEVEEMRLVVVSITLMLAFYTFKDIRSKWFDEE